MSDAKGGDSFLSLPLILTVACIFFCLFAYCQYKTASQREYQRNGGTRIVYVQQPNNNMSSNRGEVVMESHPVYAMEVNSNEVPIAVVEDNSELTQNNQIKRF